MKTIIMLTTAFTMASLALLAFGIDRAAAAEAQDNGKKIMVAYFSYSGNTREIANQIQQRVGGDLFEIKAADPYPAEYRACTDRAKAEQERDARPALSGEVRDMSTYDVIFIGYPNWWGTIPMPLFTFFETYDFSGKTIIPFCTHEGSGLGRSMGDIRKLSPKSTVLEGLAVRGSGVKSAQDSVAAWLRGAGMAK